MADQVLTPETLARIDRNVQRMVTAGAPKADIDLYLQSEQNAPGMSATDQLYDYAVSPAVGVAEGVIGAAGLPGTASQLARQAWTGITKNPPPQVAEASGAPTPEQIQRGVEQFTGPFYESRTPGGHALRALGQNAIGAIAPGSPMRRILGGVVGPTVGSEVAGEFARGTPYETAAKVAGGVGGGILGSMATTGINAARGVNNVTGMPIGASNVLKQTLTPDAEGRLAKFGPDAFLAESTPATFGAAQGVATRPGAGQAVLRNAYEGRQGATNARLGVELDRELGFASVPSDIERTINNTRAAIGQQYPKALADMPPADVRPIIARLDREIALEAGAPQRALEEIKGYLQGKSTGQELHNVREAIDSLIARHPDDKNVARVATIFRREVDNLMSPEVKALDAKIQELARQQEAMSLGGRVMSTGKEALRPQELAEILQNGMDKKGPMSAGQQSALRIGARAELDRAVGTSANDAAALKKIVQSEGDWNREKLAQIFGQQEADNILRSIDKEAAFQTAYTKMINNAETASRLGGQQLVETQATRAPTRADITLGGMVLAPAQMAYRKMGDLIRGGRTAEVDDALGRAFATQGPERDAIIRNIRAAQDSTARNRTHISDELLRLLMAGSVSP